MSYSQLELQILKRITLPTMNNSSKTHKNPPKIFSIGKNDELCACFLGPRG